MPKKIHYLYPANGLDACGKAGSSPQTSNINEVTCKACLRELTGEYKGGRPPKHQTPTHKTAFALSPKAFERLRSVENKSEFVSKLIENS